jgi:hypothetical protein
LRGQERRVEPDFEVHVFLSYQHEDKRLVDQLKHTLELLDFNTFMDTGIQIGSNWDIALEEALFSSYAVVPCWTPRSVKSRWVRLEARYGLSNNMLCPVLLEPCALPIEFSDVHAASLLVPHSWTRADAEFDALCARLEHLRAAPLPDPSNQEARLFIRLAEKYEAGDGVPKNLVLAKEWYQRAESAGHPAATERLARLGSS